MSLNSNQQIFEEFQRSVDQAITMAMKLGPEHFYLAYDRCAKLQKVIFKRSCGYCSSNEMNTECTDVNVQETIRTTPPFNMCYLNLPNMSLCRPPAPIVPYTHPNNDTQTHNVHKVILLRHTDQILPSQSEMVALEKEGVYTHNCVLPPSRSVQEAINYLLRYFPGLDGSQYELCLANTDNSLVLRPLQDSDMHSLRTHTTIILRPIVTKPSAAMDIKAESSLSPLSFSTSDGSANSGHRLNSFITDTDTTMVDNVNSAEASGFVFPETMFSAIEMKPFIPEIVAGTKPQRKYNWSVILTKLHEKMPVSLNHEILPSPNKCHELHVIPPTTQKLRPTKRCQLCLKGYRSRKESRYYCKACDKGFHIKCFELYHGQVGCADFKVRIIGTEH